MCDWWTGCFWNNSSVKRRAKIQFSGRPPPSHLNLQLRSSLFCFCILHQRISKVQPRRSPVLEPHFSKSQFQNVHLQTSSVASNVLQKKAFHASAKTFQPPASDFSCCFNEECWNQISVQYVPVTPEWTSGARTPHTHAHTHTHTHTRAIYEGLKQQQSCLPASGTALFCQVTNLCLFSSQPLSFSVSLCPKPALPTLPLSRSLSRSLSLMHGSFPSEGHSGSFFPLLGSGPVRFNPNAFWRSLGSLGCLNCVKVCFYEFVGRELSVAYLYLCIFAEDFRMWLWGKAGLSVQISPTIV